MKPVSLYEKCSTCDGHGRVPEYHDRPRIKLCPLCGGMGQKPTMDGRSIIELIRAAKVDELLPG